MLQVEGVDIKDSDAKQKAPAIKQPPGESKEGASFYAFLSSMWTNAMQYIFGRNDKR